MTDPTTIELHAEGITVELTDAGRRALLVVHRHSGNVRAGTATSDEARTVNASAIDRLEEQLLAYAASDGASGVTFALTDFGDKVVAQLYGDPSSSGPEVGA